MAVGGLNPEQVFNFINSLQKCEYLQNIIALLRLYGEFVSETNRIRNMYCDYLVDDMRDAFYQMKTYADMTAKTLLVCIEKILRNE